MSLHIYLTDTNPSIAASNLHSSRLTSQYLNVYRVLSAMSDVGSCLHRHPLTNMWRSYPRRLAQFGIECCALATGEAVLDAYRSSVLDMVGFMNVCETCPPWLDNTTVIINTRKNLLWRCKYDFETEFMVHRDFKNVDVVMASQEYAHYRGLWRDLKPEYVSYFQCESKS